MLNKLKILVEALIWLFLYSYSISIADGLIEKGLRLCCE